MDSYEKKYNEALERAKQVHEYSSDLAEIKRMEQIFPELKESEDEKIRKAILNYLTKMWGNSQDDVCGVHVEDAIAWLEEQGEKLPVIRWYDVSLIPQEGEELLVEWDSEDATWHEIAFYHADTKTFWNGERQVKNVTRWCYIIDLLEKQGEQKPTDKVEPKFPKGEKGEEGFTYQYPPTNIGHNEGINTPGKKPILVDVDDLPDNPLDAFAKGVEKARSEMKSEPQTVTFIDSGTMQVIEKLDEIIGKLGDIHQVLSKPFVFPYRDYTPLQAPWYKTHGVERVPPVTCETTNKVKAEDGKDV